jgi:hypothetical protein
LVYRFVRRPSMDPAVLVEELESDEEANAPCDSRELRYPELREARSVFEPEAAALRRWRTMRRGAEQRREELAYKFIAQLRIGPDEGLCVERRGKQGHVLLWGDKTKLAEAVIRVFAGSDEANEED